MTGHFKGDMLAGPLPGPGRGRQGDIAAVKLLRIRMSDSRVERRKVAEVCGAGGCRGGWGMG